MSPACCSNFVSSYSIVIPFIIEFSCRIAIVKVSTGNRNRYGELKWISLSNSSSKCTCHYPSNRLKDSK